MRREEAEMGEALKRHQAHKRDKNLKDKNSRNSLNIPQSGIDMFSLGSGRVQ